MRPEGRKTCSEGPKNEVALHKHIKNHGSMDCDWRINAIEFYRQYRAMIAAIKTLTEFSLSIHHDPCDESLAEPKIDHMGMTTAEALPVAADELGIKNVVNGESPPPWTFMWLLMSSELRR